MKVGLFALATVAFATAASAAPAENPFARDQAVLQLKGLDLATAEGQQRLAIRMDNVARSVCGQSLSGVHLSAERKSQDCQAAVKADIRNRIETRMARSSTVSKVRLASAN